MGNAIVLGSIFLMLIGLSALPSVVFGQMEHSGTKHEHVMKSPTKEITVDGIKVQFWVETMMEHHQMMW